MSLNLSLGTSQNFSLQVKTSMALDQGLDDVHEIVTNYEHDLTSKKFVKDIKNYFLNNQKKSFFSKSVPKDAFLKENKDLLESVIDYATKRHKDEVRDSGHPYLAHVLSTGFVLARLGFPQEVVNAGILHDCVEGSLDKTKVLNDLYKLNPAFSFYVFSVSAPEIQDAVERDKVLYDKLVDYSKQSNSIFPKVIKCIDSLVNLYDVEEMSAKDGRSAKSRQLRFLATSRNKILPFAKEIDLKGIIPLRKKDDVFSLEEYTKETIEHKSYLVSFN